ncbi:MAG: succinyl-diaminopimelate desuccinylase [Hyphomonadaceae bacterium]|nr:succinyl-diaminopimelate desuccinylase [Hyphomonadaceae bacterium]
MTLDPISLAQALIRRPSVTPIDAGALDVLGEALADLGFTIRRFHFGEVDNLYARLGERSDGAPNFCFAGHTDVAPVGDAAAWSVDPFGGDIKDDRLWGRGAADMKAAIAAMVAGVDMHLSVVGAPRGAISFLITGDEEGPAVNGTVKLLPAIAEAGEILDHCLVGEPTSVALVADTIKNGRRGSLNARIEARGVQGHVAYPDEAHNPMPALLDLAQTLRARKLDDGAPGFQPSNLEVTSIDVGNPAHNVIPASATARLNIRFNTAHQGADLRTWIETEAARVAERTGVAIAPHIAVTGEAFFTPPSSFTELVASAAEEVTGRTAKLSTAGGTSDARFIKDYCPVAELGLQNATAHKVDENVLVEDVRTLARIYATILTRYFPK